MAFNTFTVTLKNAENLEFKCHFDSFSKYDGALYNCIVSHVQDLERANMWQEADKFLSLSPLYSIDITLLVLQACGNTCWYMKNEIH